MFPRVALRPHSSALVGGLDHSCGGIRLSVDPVELLRLDIMSAATDDDIWDAMCTEEKLIHADLDEDLELYLGPARFGGVITWYLSKDEALVALPGQRNVATCRAERRRCLLQLCPTGVFVIPLGSEA